jgi:hypothetical protein
MISDVVASPRNGIFTALLLLKELGFQAVGLLCAPFVRAIKVPIPVIVGTVSAVIDLSAFTANRRCRHRLRYGNVNRTLKAW